MSSNCFDTHCSEGCCNYYGSCPDHSSTSTLSNQCYYHYDDFDSYWIIAPIVFAVFFIGFIVCFCIARKRQQNIDGTMEVAANTQVTTVNNQQNMGWNQPHNDPFNQPPPYNNDPFSQPPPYNNDPYNQQPNQFQPPNQFQQPNQFQAPSNQYSNPPAYNQGAFNPADNNYNPGNNYYQQQPYPGY